MQKLMLAVVAVLGAAAPAVAQTREPGSWKTDADFALSMAQFQWEAAAFAEGAAKASYAAANPEWRPVEAEWEKNEAAYKAKMPAGVYADAAQFFQHASLDMTEAFNYMVAGYTWRNTATEKLAYGDVAYELGLYHEAYLYYTEAFDALVEAETRFADADPLYYHALADAVCLAALLAQYPLP